MDEQRGAPKPHLLSRDALQSGFVEEMIARAGVSLQILSEGERRASLEATLAAQPTAGDVWLFAYGSLIWNPAIAFAERQPAIIRGWHRQFCLSTPVGRGTPEQPGLVLGLDCGGSCRGVAFRISSSEARAELELVWRREMVTGAYVPRWVRLYGKVIPAGTFAIAFTINRQAPNYVRLASEAETARIVSSATGVLGSCKDYLLDTVQGLKGFGIRNRHLDRMAQIVRPTSPATAQAQGSEGC
jgi:cation transport protein ChaC